MVSARTGRRPGRPTKDTPANRSAVLLALSLGQTRTGAAGSVGIHYETLRTWIANDPEFSVAVEHAEAAAETYIVDMIWAAAPKEWRAAAWWLERRRRDDYGKHQRAEVTFDEERAAEAVAAETGMTKEAVLAEVERIAREFSF